MTKSKKAPQSGTAETKPQSANDLTKFYWVLGIVAILGIGIVGYSVSSRSTGNMATTPIAIAGLDDPGTLKAMTHGVTKGNPSAPLTIMEFGDFQCPACGEFFRTVEPAVVTEFINTGRAKFVFYDFPLVNLHPNAFVAARAAHCAEDQGKFWEYHDQLYGNQQIWSSLPDPSPVFEEFAGVLGLDDDAFKDCLRSDRHQDLVTANMQLAYVNQAPGTPTIMVGSGMLRQVPSTLEGIREAMDGLGSAPTAQ